MSAAVEEKAEDAPMVRYQWTVVAICVALNLLDGFDVLVMSFTGKAISADWDLSSSELGLLLSAGLVGMAVGSAAIAPWADRIGRRPIVLGCLAVAGTGMILSSLSQSAVQLGALRVLTGIGIGGILAASNVLSAEYASRRWRGLAVSLNSTGYAIGAVNALRGRLGQEPLDVLPEPESQGTRLRANYRRLLAPDLRRTTVLLWVTFFCVMAGFYFVTSWTPTLLVEAGLSTSAGVTGGMLLNLGGIFGTAALGLLAARIALRHVVIAYLIATAVFLAAFIASTSALAVAFAVGGVVGLLVNGCVAGLYALTSGSYEVAVRTTGMGTGLAFGRVGAVLAPTLAGAFLDAGATPEQLYLAAGVIFVLAAVAVASLRRGTVAGVRTPVTS